MPCNGWPGSDDEGAAPRGTVVIRPRTVVGSLGPVELRVQNERAVVTVEGGGGLDPGRLPVSEDLVAALHEWARVAVAVEKAGHTNRTRDLVVSRGEQLAKRLAHAVGHQVTYVDPFTGAGYRFGEAGHGGSAETPREPTPWATGITVSVLCCLVVLVGMATLYTTLAEAAQWLALLADIVLTAGLVPSVLLVRRMPVWRWVAYGVSTGLALGWLGWLIGLVS